MENIFQLLNSEVLMGEKETPSKLYVKWDSKKVQYITTDVDGSNHKYFESTVHPENLTDEQRERVLDYVLSDYVEGEIVNFNDLFLQMEFVKETAPFEHYTLVEQWLNY